MSLGFLTESALLPSKAKAIRVDSKSLVDLRAVVFQKEQERQERKRQLEHALHSDDDLRDSNDKATAGVRGFGKYAQLRAKKARGAVLTKEEEQIGKSSNRGVETRRKRDEAAQELVPDDDDDAAWHKKSKAMLEKKAKMYDDMMKKGGKPGAECLVDFSAKQRASTRETGNDGVEDSSSQQVEITDEFGRVRFVARGSVEHTEFLQSHAGKEADPTMSDQKDAAAAHSSEQHNGGSFVTSQWEKRFNAQEKTYLQQVHEGVHQAKSALHEKKMRKQLRLEKLKRQAGGQQNANPAPTANISATVTPLDAQEEQAAAVKATEFLNQFGSLM
uniref:Uncharacterized protein n=1 Tax=Globisporangium ultimum (strain ATCC 200006 / CBS 805.95 / DAOM BR144) TaxID=431595 RepID=K3WHF6_GLOUD